MKSAKIYDFTIPANGSFQLNVEGDNIRVMTSTGAVEIVTDSMRLGPLRAGQGQANSPFKRVTLNDKSGSGNVGSILVASSDFIDQRINGEVSVIDGGKSRTLANLAFMGNATINAVGGLLPVVALFNLPGSVKNLIVESYSYTSTVPGFWASAINTVYPATLSNYPSSKKSGGALSAGQIRIDNVATTPAAGQIVTGSFVANASAIVTLREPIVLTPGYGLICYNSNLNSDLSATFEYYEDPI